MDDCHRGWSINGTHTQRALVAADEPLVGAAAMEVMPAGEPPENIT